MRPPDRFSFYFLPVGQGLFSSGTIRNHDETAPRFLWVYDCGTSSSPKLIDKGIERLERSMGTRHRIDLLTLSHFDMDHISGVCRLIGEFRIGTLMLPYMPLVQRLIIAFAEGTGGPHDALTGFFLNPVAYVLAQGGPGIERILFVPASGGEGPPMAEGAGKTPDQGDDNPSIDFRDDKPNDREEIDPLFEAVQNAGVPTRVEFLRKGSAITFKGLWEFVPYNDDPEVEIDEEFKTQVAQKRQRLLGGGPLRARNNALRSLKKIYDKTFGDDSEERNLISLFLYSGPIYPSWRNVWLSAAAWKLSSRFFWARRPPIFPVRLPQRCSIIYPGDGYLDTGNRLRRMLDFFREERVSKTGVFQVMHHGAEANWHKGVAGAIAPGFSVFSSHPEHKKFGHPHAPVVRDFWRWGPIQVDKRFGFHVAGRLRARF